VVFGSFGTGTRALITKACDPDTLAPDSPRV
jgi:hypothetical protein